MRENENALFPRNAKETDSEARNKFAADVRQTQEGAEKATNINRPTAPQYILCKNCGNANQPGSRFCTICGKHFDDAPFVPKEIWMTSQSGKLRPIRMDANQVSLSKDNAFSSQTRTNSQSNGLSKVIYFFVRMIVFLISSLIVSAIIYRIRHH